MLLLHFQTAQCAYFLGQSEELKNERAVKLNLDGWDILSDGNMLLGALLGAVGSDYHPDPSKL